MGGGRGTGLSFGHTVGSQEVAASTTSVQLSLGIAAGDASFMGGNEAFLRNIRNRRDVDPGGVFDLIAHGTSSGVQVEHLGSTLTINSRVAASRISRLPGYHGQDIRLLSCSTGARSDGFAQNLANKLGVSVWAPSDLLWARPDGTHFVAPRDPRHPNRPHPWRRGTFIEYKPGGNR